MSLDREGILKLQFQGFREAEAAGLAIARAFVAIEGALVNVVGRSGAAASAITTLGSTVEGARASMTNLETAAVKGLDAVAEKGKSAGEAVRGALEGAAEKGKAAFEQIAQSAEGAASGIKAAFAGVGLAVVGVGAAITLGLVQHAGRVAGVEHSFEALAQRVGGAEAALNRLRTASGGAIGDLTLMTGANRLLMSDVGITSDQMGKLAAAAVNLGRATGVSAKEAFEDLARGVQTGHVRMIEELGATIDVEDATKKYAEANGLAADQLDQRTRRQIILNTVLAATDEMQKKLHVSGDAAASPVARLSAAWENFGERLEKTLAENPAVIGALESLSGAAMHLVNALVPVVTTIATVVAKLGEMKLLVPLIEAFLGSKLGAAIADTTGLSDIPGIGGFVRGGAQALGALGGGAYGAATQGDGPGGGPSTINVNVPLHDETIDRTATRAGQVVGQAMRRRLDDVQGSLGRSLSLGLEGSFANAFEAGG